MFISEFDALESDHLDFEFIKLNDFIPHSSETSIHKVLVKKSSNLYPLYIVKLINELENAEQDLDYFLNQKLIKIQQIYFHLSNCNSRFFELLLDSNCFAISIDPIHKNEFFGHVSKFFNYKHQNSLLQQFVLDQIELTQKEKLLLYEIMKYSHHGVNRKALFEKIWPNLHVSHKTLDVHLFKLRKKLEPYNIEIVYENQIWRVRFDESKLISHTLNIQAPPKDPIVQTV